jgi:hypothetical protein
MSTPKTVNLVNNLNEKTEIVKGGEVILFQAFYSRYSEN